MLVWTFGQNGRSSRVMQSFMHIQGMPKVTHCNPEWYEAVVPNYFDLNDFEYCHKRKRTITSYFLVGYIQEKVSILPFR